MAWTDENGKPLKKLPAIPPDDYKGTLADWVVGLQERGFMTSDDEWYGDIQLDVDDYNELLDWCERD